MKAKEKPPIFWGTISKEMREVMRRFSDTEIGSRFYLAGGTALALQLGHRLSVDLDFFSPTEDIPSIRSVLAEALASFDPILADTSWGNLVFLAQGVQIGFYGYGYPLVSPSHDADGTSLASIADIGLMKLDTLLSRASRKDFYDLYAICERMTLRELFDLAQKKHTSSRDFEAQVVKRLAFFERADVEDDPILLKEVSWEKVKSFFREKAIEFGQSWIE
ncbi:MAG: hypothetical protein B6I38_02055 [Anaerolineaceae bacterium 4572_5.1]|nr:MAG: hypothetical protein B6I38_02055 [Anaerolineaceae bacterium 4572_5.1]